MSELVKFTFTLGGINHKVLLEDVPGYRWKNSAIEGIIRLSPKYNGEDLQPATLRKNMWEAIFSLIHEHVMQRTKKGVFTEYRRAYANLVSQAMEQLITWLNSNLNNNILFIGGSTIRVSENNKYCESRECYGEYDINVDAIRYQTQTTIEGNVVVYSRAFIMQVIIHEVLHAISHQLGLNETKWNTEHQINTLAHFLCEVLYSLFEHKTETI